MDFLEAATAAIAGAERRIEVASRNIANAQTPGYKREISYTQIMNSGLQLASTDPVTRSAIFTEAGVLTETGGALDFAIRGDAYVVVRSGGHFFLSRGGQFQRDSEGAMVDSQGRIVQQAGGGDLLLDTDTPEIISDGTILSDGVPIGSIGLFRAGADIDVNAYRAGFDEAGMQALPPDERSVVAQGMIERSNVILSDEMIGLMRTQRLAESGAQLVRVYDQIIGQAVSTFGRRGG